MVDVAGDSYGFVVAENFTDVIGVSHGVYCGARIGVNWMEWLDGEDDAHRGGVIEAFGDAIDDLAAVHCERLIGAGATDEDEGGSTAFGSLVDGVEIFVDDLVPLGFRGGGEIAAAGKGGHFKSGVAGGLAEILRRGRFEVFTPEGDAADSGFRIVVDALMGRPGFCGDGVE